MTELEILRARIDALDDAWLALLGERFETTAEVSALKTRDALPAQDPAREAAQRNRLRDRARQCGVDPDLAATLLDHITTRVVQDHERHRRARP